MSTLRQLAYFVAVAEQGSFTRAARSLFVAQPSLSQQIRTLEAEIGADLVERLPRSVKLTAAGRAFLPHARRAVAEAEEAVRAAREVCSGFGEIEIGTTRSVAVGLLPEILEHWYTEHPRTRVKLVEQGAGVLEQWLRTGIGDIAIGPRPATWSGPLSDLGWEEFVLVLPHSDRLSREERVPLEMLANREWVMFDQAVGLTDLITRACQDVGGFTPRRGVETAQVETAARLAAAGIGPTLVPRAVLPRDLRGAVVQPDPPIGRQLSVFRRTLQEPLAERFVALLLGQEWTPRPDGAYGFVY